MEHQTKGTLRNQAVITSAGSPRATTPRFVRYWMGAIPPNADPIGGFRREPSCVERISTNGNGSNTVKKHPPARGKCGRNHEFAYAIKYHTIFCSPGGFMPFRANFVISFGRSIGQTLFQNFF